MPPDMPPDQNPNPDPPILFNTRGALGIITLNRPKTLNALSLAMISSLAEHITRWEGDDRIAAIMIRAAPGRAFCAGGDVREIWQAGPDDRRFAASYFRAEYRLDRQIKCLAKPVVALLDGIVMGGGVGISFHATRRVVSERALFAMPETGLGLFPDVGAGFLFARCPGRAGLYLGLTGARIGAGDLCRLGLATDHVAAAAFPELEAALADAVSGTASPAVAVDDVLSRFQQEPPEAPVLAARTVIDRCFSPATIEEILTALRAEDDALARQAADDLAQKSPTSLKVTLADLRQAAELPFDAVMRMNYRLSQAFLRAPDFYEGVRALLIDKDRQPAWNPATLADVDAERVAGYFAPPDDGDLDFD